ncbi:hypothetical protein TNCV_2797521 [Trichonephila clavipes]|nr:hypothetical protein TNCV_2797521 [Trichonephila clavipes]
MPPTRQCQIEAKEIHQGKELDCTPFVSRSYEHHAIDSTTWLASIPVFRENTLRGEGSSLFPFYQPHERTGGSTFFRVPPCREGTIHLQASMSSAGFKPGPYGTAVGMANHYNEWETLDNLETSMIFK